MNMKYSILPSGGLFPFLTSLASQGEPQQEFIIKYRIVEGSTSRAYKSCTDTVALILVSVPDRLKIVQPDFGRTKSIEIHSRHNKNHKVIALDYIYPFEQEESLFDVTL